MADLINLNRFRKARRRTEETKESGENRVRFGRSKEQQRRDQQERDRKAKELDGKKID
jgi:hypothetical protein